MINWLHTIFIERPRKFINSGSRIKDEYLLKDIDGKMELVKVSESNLYEYIQSHKDSVDINKMLERYRQGDITALDRVKAQYLDLDGAPENLAEMYSFVRNTSAFFETLPLSVREEYEHNVSKFVADIGSEHFINLFKEKDLKPTDEIPFQPEPIVDKEIVKE